MMFFCFTAFVACFLLINYKWGAVAAPVLQYGMYSGQYHLADTITFYSIQVNGKTVDPSLLPTGEHDKLQSYLDQYVAYKEGNEEVHRTMRPYLGKVGLMRFAGAEKFNIVVPANDHYQWLKNKVAHAVEYPVYEFAATRQSLKWTGTVLQQLDIDYKIPFSAAR